MSITVTNPCSEIMIDLPWDLKGIPTEVLLNEAFRRGAIKHFHANRVVSNLMLHDELYYSQVIHSLRQDCLSINRDVMEESGVFNLGKKSDYQTDLVTLSCDFFVCKHPKILKESQKDD